MNRKSVICLLLTLALLLGLTTGCGTQEPPTSAESVPASGQEQAAEPVEEPAAEEPAAEPAEEPAPEAPAEASAKEVPETKGKTSSPSSCLSFTGETAVLHLVSNSLLPVIRFK